MTRLADDLLRQSLQPSITDIPVLHLREEERVQQPGTEADAA